MSARRPRLALFGEGDVESFGSTPMPGSVEREVITVSGREVAISNPQKVLYPEAGHTKLDLARYYLAVADGALRGANGRPTVLVRYPNGIDGEFFYQKRAPESRPPWVEVVALQFPSGRSAEEVVPRDAATLVWMANLACLELHPHPVRADDLDHPHLRGPRVEREQLIEWNAELVLLFAGRNVFVRPGVHIWVGAQGDPRLHIPRVRDLSDVIELGLALDVEAVNTLLERFLDFFARFSHARERALPGLAAGRENPQ